jgi:uncharacterized protein (DUF2267 family)
MDRRRGRTRRRSRDATPLFAPGRGRAGVGRPSRREGTPERSRAGRVALPALLAGLGGVAAVVLLTPVRRVVRRTLRALRRGPAPAGRYLGGVVRGVRYRVSGRHPDPVVADVVVAERIRSALGRVERDLDIPRVHVSVVHHTAMLHGDVADESQARRVVDVASAISGVHDVRSYLHVGLTASDSTPSQGARHAGPSHAKRLLVDAAREGGVPADRAAVLADAVLTAVLERVPESTSEHLLAHLPVDLRTLVTQTGRRGLPRGERTLDAFIEDVASAALLEEHVARTGARTVVQGLQKLVPEEVDAVAAVLPPELRGFWLESAAS